MRKIFLLLLLGVSGLSLKMLYAVGGENVNSVTNPGFEEKFKKGDVPPGAEIDQSVSKSGNKSFKLSRADTSGWSSVVQTAPAKYGKEMVAPEMKERVVYYDERRDISWVSDIDKLVTFLDRRGFITKDAAELKSWMQAKITKGADGTVCIMAMGTIPDNISENLDSTCTFRRYMDAGGRVVWIGDIPLFYQSFLDRTPVVWGGQTGVLGIRDGMWGMLDKRAEITETGKEWGMQAVDDPVRTIQGESATLAFSEVPGTPYACSYFKNYNPEFPYSGFLRYRAASYDGKNTALNNDLYRLALYRGKQIKIIPEAEIEVVAALAIETTLRNYPRGMSIPVTVKIDRELKGDEIRLKIVDGKRVVREFESPVNREILFNLKTEDLASKDYILAGELLKDNKIIAKAEKEIFLAPKKTAKFPMGMFTVRLGGTEYKRDVVLKDLKEHLGECGVITGTGFEGRDWDEALRFGLRVMPVSEAYYGSMISRSEHPELQMRVSTGDLPTYHFGNMSGAPICMGNPVNRERINAYFKGEIKDAMKYPAFMKRFYVSEDVALFGNSRLGEFGVLACYCEYCKKEFKRLTGFDAPVSPSEEVMKKKGIVHDNDPWYLWMKFRSNDTYGYWNRSMEEAKNELDPEIKFGPIPAGAGMVGNPVLLPSWGLNPPDNYGGIGMASFYYYPQLWIPAICFMPYSALAIMGNRDKELWVIPQSYEGLINDQLAQERLIRNEFYYLLAAGTKGMTYFAYPQMPGTEAWEEFKNLSKIGTKFGPLLLKLKRKPAKVAILASYCNASYHRGGYSRAIENLYMSLLKSHVSADMIADEEIIKDSLKEYEVLILTEVDYLTESISKKMADFIAQGGIVLRDESSEINIPGSITVAEASFAERVKKITRPLVEVSTPDLIVTEFIGNEAKYLMFVNYCTDKSTSGEITLKGIKNYQLYDIFSGQSLKDENGRFNLTIEPAGGKLIGIYPDGIEKISVEAPREFFRGEHFSFKVEIRGKKGETLRALLPIKVSIKDPKENESEYSDYYVTENGRMNISFVPAVNDTKGKWKAEIKELSSGISKNFDFRIR